MAKDQKPSNKLASHATKITVRADKWLWAARFFKTRSIANVAIKTGKISSQGTRIKASRELQAGDCLTIKQGHFEKTVVIKGLAERRGSASAAQALYEETADSINKREHQQQLRKAQPAPRDPGLGRPTKRERRSIINFTKKTNAK
jgi:ribosome-associated heat shock protein Hsp15